MRDPEIWHKRFIWWAMTVDEGFVFMSHCWARKHEGKWQYSITDPHEKK